MRFTYIIIVFIVIGCRPTSSQSKHDNKNILGHWAESADKNVDFTFKENGIIKYFEDNDIYNYSIKNKELEITQEGHFITKYSIILLSKDSLHIRVIEGNIIKLVKRKE